MHQLPSGEIPRQRKATLVHFLRRWHGSCGLEDQLRQLRRRQVQSVGYLLHSMPGGPIPGQRRPRFVQALRRGEIRPI